MALNWAWVGLFTVAFATAFVRWLLGEHTILQALLTALFDGARSGFIETWHKPLDLQFVLQRLDRWLTAPARTPAAVTPATEREVRAA